MPKLFNEKIHKYLNDIYKPLLNKNEIQELSNKVYDLFSNISENQNTSDWSKEDVFLITYGDSLIEKNEKKLQTLNKFLNTYCKDFLTNIHILPFFPYTSDDGFAVKDYHSVRDDLGSWEDIISMSKDFKIMSDIVINHASSESIYFKNFLEGDIEYKDFFTTTDNENEYEDVIRPRTSKLFKKFIVDKQEKSLWCTFSHDQIDFNFKNPNVLIFFLKILKLYLDNGIKIFRLDAVAFLWKEPFTSCLNLPQTHNIVKLIRTIIDYTGKETMLITETNLPDHENLSYFGEYDEANAIYNFGLPPMLLWTMAMGDSTVIRKWLMSMPPAKEGTCYLNFIASHDGIGLRPTEGILTDDQRTDLVEIMKNFGAHVSYRKSKNNKELPYEINISLLDAMKGSKLGEDHLQVERLICIHTIMLGLEGIPALYIHSLIGSENDYELMDKNQNKRSINRSQLEYNYLKKVLSNPETKNYKIFHQLKKIIQLKRKQNGLHPNATQFTFNLGTNFFALWRQSIDKKQSIFCISNITNVFQYLDLSEVNLIATENWTDLITGEKIKDIQGTVALKAYQTLWISNVKPN